MKKAQFQGLTIFFVLFVTIVLYFLLLPLINGALDLLIPNVSSAEVKLLFKLIPFAMLFGIVLKIFSLKR